MQALKFKATIKNGVIAIPREYRDRFPEHVSVIIIPEAKTQGEDAIDRLLSNPLNLPDFRPLSREAVHERRH